MYHAQVQISGEMQDSLEKPIKIWNTTPLQYRYPQ